MRPLVPPVRTKTSPNTTPQFEPTVPLPVQEIKMLGEDEEGIFKMWAKLF